MIHFIIVSSTHIGLCWGTPGWSGMQVQPLLPWRRIRPCVWVFGSVGQSMTVAFSAMTAGAALNAFLIFHSSGMLAEVITPGGNGSLTGSCLPASSTNANGNRRFMVMGLKHRPHRCHLIQPHQ